MKSLDSEYFSPTWHRCLALLKLAFSKTVFTKEELVNPVDGRESIYDDNIGLDDAFSHDRYLLRDTLDIHIEALGGRHSRGKYQIKRIGPRFAKIFLPTGLTTLLALAQLPQVAPNFPPELLHELLDEVRHRLGPKGSDVLDEALAGAEQLAHWRDPDPLDSNVIARLRRAVQERRLVVFDYQPSRTDDNALRRHLVEPYRLYSHEGHFYLDGYAQQTDGPYGVQKGRHYDFRIGRIVPESVEISDDHYLVERPRPHYVVHYVLSSKLAKGGGSRSFDEDERWLRADGRMEIRAHTEKPFDAMRKLLSYGAECEVLGGEEVLRYYRTELDRMLKSYNESNK